MLASKYKRIWYLLKSYPREGGDDLIGQVRDELQNMVTFDQSHLDAVRTLIAQARITKHARPNIRTEFESYTAVGLVLEVLCKLRVSWNKQLAELRHGKRLDAALNDLEHSASSWPAPEELIAFIEEEKALALLFLNEQSTPAASQSPQSQSDESYESIDSRLKINRWSELAIGIDAHGYWAFVEVPEIGQRVLKTQAYELQLPGKRWNKLLELLAASPDGQMVSKTELITALGWMPGTSRGIKDGRARPGECVHALSEENIRSASRILKRFDNMLADLRRELKKIIDIPKGKTRCLQLEGEIVKAGFIVAPLFDDGAGHYRFGNAK
jgi:hypothetical protein